MDWLKKLITAIAEWIRKCIPSYEPGQWNDFNGIQFHNNCYNYACNIQTGTRAQPGKASSNQYSSINCEEVTDGATSDGLVENDCDIGCGCKDCCHQVALVIWPGYDYHWYRKDKNGKWSHKPGQTEATNLDNSGNIINNPRTADRGGYTIFCGCFCVCKGKVTIS